MSYRFYKAFNSRRYLRTKNLISINHFNDLIPVDTITRHRIYPSDE